jgi:signal transduction histidine kinase
MTARSDGGGVLAGGGEMGRLMRSIDWSRTAVGPVESWPQSLRTALSILLDTGFPMYIAWGTEFTQFYNDGYRPILGSTKHPAAMGISTRETFAEIWDIIGPMFHGVMQGQSTTLVDFMLPLDRYGFTEECYFIFSYSPIREERGSVGGVLVTVTETTQRVIGERRLKITQALAAETRAATTVAGVCEIAGRVLGRSAADVPGTRIYLATDDRSALVLSAVSGEPVVAPGLTSRIAAGEEPFARIMRSGEAEVLDAGPAGRLSGGILAVPIKRQGADQPVGLLVGRTSPLLILDESYRGFFSLVASQIGAAVAAAKALEEAQARADALAELDRAKTAFFGNVSHEFRTPLTLMLGPTEEALASPDRSLRGEDLETVHRNELRLLKLVNTLLDFSRIEAGRVSAAFEPTDLSALTIDLASAFRSAIERAGLRFIVDCPPLESPVDVDREMWEKIVLNLLSNAFKFTFEGSIAVELRQDAGEVELRVRDTGTGIEAADIERIFDRFHRVQRAAARAHEGSGIGLALVRELVTIHGGSISASSTPGEGTVFRVRIPVTQGSAVSEQEAPRPAARDARASAFAPYLAEALRWLPSDPAVQTSDTRATPERAIAGILVADDNADMRDYLSRLLSDRFQVTAVGDGRSALGAARRSRPDVIVSDVMMPAMDGFELLSALRAAEDTRKTPVILLSARAGEEARIEALEAGADDYLVKPFSARELVARIEAQLVRAKLRSLEEAHTLRLTSVFEHAPVGIAILSGPHHVYEFANRQYLELVGGREVVGMPVRDALPELAGQGIFELLDEVYRSGEPFTGRSIRAVIQRHGSVPEETFFDLVYQPLSDDRGAVTGIAVVAFDVTELTKARREAESANRAKDEFLAMLGHELRNPLAPIQTALQLMRLRNYPGAERERTIIERQVRNMVALVDDLLDVSRITRGKVQLKKLRVDLAEIVGKSIEMTSPAIEERRHVLNVQVPRGLAVNADPARLAQVVANLLTNAAKYTDPGGLITVTAHADGGAGVVTVADTGRGIAPEMLPRIFDLFSQERQEIDRSEGGLGLGLAIVRTLVQAHGGTVEAHSRGKGHGAEFSIRLPLASGTKGVPDADAVAASAPADPVPPIPGLRVLVVDDNPDAADLLSEFLRALGHTTRVAHNGLAAVQLAEQFQPEVVLLDLGLPVMDGFEVADRLRGLPSLRGTELVAITGYGQEVDRQRTREGGFHEHMVKPVDLDELEAWLRRSQEARDRGRPEPPLAGE